MAPGRPATWRPALAGAGALYLVTPMSPDFPAHLVGDLMGEAARAGVTRVVLLSGLSAGYGSVPMLSREEPVRAADVEWTVLRPGAFSQNFSAGPHRSAVREGVLRMPLGPDVRSAYIDVQDIARTAVTVLTGDPGRAGDGRPGAPDHSGRIYDLAGPEALSFPDVCARIADATGRELRYEEVGSGEWEARQRAAGVPDAALARSLETFEALRRGAYAGLHDGVQRVTGQAPRAFAAAAREAAARGDWDGVTGPRGEARTGGGRRDRGRRVCGLAH